MAEALATPAASAMIPAPHAPLAGPRPPGLIERTPDRQERPTGRVGAFPGPCPIGPPPMRGAAPL